MLHSYEVIIFFTKTYGIKDAIRLTLEKKEETIETNKTKFVKIICEKRCILDHNGK